MYKPVINMHMYLCICNKVLLEDYHEDPEYYTEVMGSGCGKCIEWLKSNRYPGTDTPIFETDNPLAE